MERREKKTVYKVQRTDGKRNISQQLSQKYNIEIVEEIWEALKDLLDVTIKKC